MKVVLLDISNIKEASDLIDSLRQTNGEKYVTVVYYMMFLKTLIAAAKHQHVEIVDLMANKLLGVLLDTLDFEMDEQMVTSVMRSVDEIGTIVAAAGKLMEAEDGTRH